MRVSIPENKLVRLEAPKRYYIANAEPNIRFYADVTLLMLYGYQLGSLYVSDWIPRQLQIEQIDVLQTLSCQVVYPLEVQRNLMDYQQTEEERDRFFNLSLDMMSIATLDGYFIKLNPTWQATLGYSIEELKRTPFIAFVYPKYRAKTLAEFEQLIRSSTTPNFENRYRCQDGSYKWFSWTAIPVVELGVVYAIARIKDATGQIIGASKIAREIGDRKPIEIALRNSEEQFRHAFEDASIGMALVALDRRWIRVNPALCKIVWILLNASLIRDKQENPLHFISQIQDISERKKAEESLQQQAERERIIREVAQRIRRSLNLNQIFNTTVVEIRNLLYTDRVFIYQFEPDWSGVIIVESVDSNWRSVLGQTLDDPFFKQPDGRGLYEQERSQAIADIHTERLTDCHLQLLEQFQIRANLVVPILQEESLWGLLMANHCSTPRQWQAWAIDLLKQLSTQVAIAIQQSQIYQKVQLELLERKRAEHKNQEQAAILNIAIDAIFVHNLHDRILYWNKGSEQLYGWLVAEVYERDTNELLHNKTPNVMEIYQAVLRTDEWHGELQQTTKDGIKLIVESRWTLVTNESDQPKLILVVNTDITQKKLLERQFLRSQRMESIGTLAGGVAHDLNNILAPILMSAQLLRTKLSDEQSQQWLGILETSAIRGSKLFEQVLSFTRGIEGEHGILQIRHLITEIKQIVEETFPKSIQIYTYIPRELT